MEGGGLWRGDGVLFWSGGCCGVSNINEMVEYALEEVISNAL